MTAFQFPGINLALATPLAMRAASTLPGWRRTSKAFRLPVIGYNVPQAVGVEITPDLFRKLAQIPGFASVKDSSGNLGAQADLIRAGLPMMNGADNLVPYALPAGFRG